jgi:hypothetical protein
LGALRGWNGATILLKRIAIFSINPDRRPFCGASLNVKPQVNQILTYRLPPQRRFATDRCAPIGCTDGFPVAVYLLVVLRLDSSKNVQKLVIKGGFGKRGTAERVLVRPLVR